MLFPVFIDTIKISFFLFSLLIEWLTLIDFSNMELDLFFWNKSHLIMVYNSFYI